MARPAPRRVKSLEKVSGIWVVLLTFSLGLVLALLVPLYPSWLPPPIVAILYLFLEFLPLLFFIFTISQPMLRWRISVGQLCASLQTSRLLSWESISCLCTLLKFQIIILGK